MSTNEFDIRNIRLLLVEDDPADARVVERHLKDAGLNEVISDWVQTASEAAASGRCVRRMGIMFLELVHRTAATGRRASHQPLPAHAFFDARNLDPALRACTSTLQRTIEHRPRGMSHARNRREGAPAASVFELLL
jgi:CheY-like chemotaxis protein